PDGRGVRGEEPTAQKNAERTGLDVDLLRSRVGPLPVPDVDHLDRLTGDGEQDAVASEDQLPELWPIRRTLARRRAPAREVGQACDRLPDALQPALRVRRRVELDVRDRLVDVAHRAGRYQNLIRHARRRLLFWPAVLASCRRWSSVKTSDAGLACP